MKVHAYTIPNGRLNGVLMEEVKKYKSVLLIKFLGQPHGIPAVSIIPLLKMEMHIIEPDTAAI